MLEDPIQLYGALRAINSDKRLIDYYYNKLFPNKKQSNMKPFNLEKALAGEPVVTRNGLPVRISGYLDNALEFHKLTGWVFMPDNITTMSWEPFGCASNAEGPMDLFMASVKKKGWINIHPNFSKGKTGVPTNMVWETEAEAKAATSYGEITVPIEWEE